MERPPTSSPAGGRSATHHRILVRRLAGMGIDVVEANSSRRFSRHLHDEFGIGLVVGGAQRSASGRGPVEAMAGDLISVNPGEVHDGIPIGHEARQWHMLYFDPRLIVSILADMVDASASGAREFARPVWRHPQAAARFQALYRSVAEAGVGGERAEIDEILPLLLEHLLDRRLPVSPARDPAVARAKTRIDDDPQASVPLAELAREAGMSRFQLVRAFAHLTGLTPHAYRVQRRIQRARRLIVQGMPLAEASVASGFFDQSHMTRCFVRSVGYSPGVYARQAPGA